MKASVIITTYKRSDKLPNAIESCLNQTFGDLEIIVVDDNGRGTPAQRETESVIKDLIETKSVRYLTMERNMGACIARNAGVDIANGEYIFFLDDDDEFLSDKVEKQVNALDANPEYAAHVAGFRKKLKGHIIYSTDAIPSIGDFKEFLRCGNFFTPMLCIRKNVFLRLKGFKDIPRYQDTYFMYHLLKGGYKVTTDPEPSYIFNEHTGERVSRKGIKDTKKSLAILRTYVTQYKDEFSSEEWKNTELRWKQLMASSLYSSNYFNRILSSKYWLNCFFSTGEKGYLPFVVKSFFPAILIKKLETAKNMIKT